MNSFPSSSASLSLEIVGVISGLLACLLFLIFHHITISNIWPSAPFMFIISAVGGFMLAKSYLVLFDNYSLLTWISYNLYFVFSLGALALLSLLIFTPKYTSEEILNADGGPLNSLVINALPLTIIWLILSAGAITFVVNHSFDGIGMVIITSAVIFLTLGLNISILGFVDILPQHEYLVEKFLVMNAMLGITFMIFFSGIRPLTIS